MEIVVYVVLFLSIVMHYNLHQLIKYQNSRFAQYQEDTHKTLISLKKLNDTLESFEGPVRRIDKIIEKIN